MMFLSILWFILIGVLWAVYLVLEGFDFGVGMLLPIMGRNGKDRTAMVRTIGPHWDGNEVWLLTAGGATFAAMPLWYATMFSGMYFALFLLLVLLIVRIVAIEWRSKINTDKWRNTWDTVHTISAYGVPLILGVAFSNLVQGMKIEAQTSAVVDGSLVMTEIPADQVAGQLTDGFTVFNLTGGFWSLFTWYTIFGGITIVAVCFAHGAQFLGLKTTGELRERAVAIGGPASIVATVLAAGWVLWGQLAYSTNNWSWIPLIIAAVALVLATINAQKSIAKEGWAFTFSSIGIVSAVAWVFSSMAPYVMKSAIDPAYSLTIDWASSTHSTLVVMTWVAVLLVPVVIAYTIWSYWVFRRRIDPDDVDNSTGLLPDSVRVNANFLTGKQA